MPDTTWVLADQSGQAVTQLSNASQRVFRAARNLGRQARVTLAHTDVEAAYLFDVLRNGVPQLRYYRTDALGARQLRLSAYLTAIEESLSDEGEDQLVLTFKDPFGRILGDGSGDDPGRVLLAPMEYASTDQGALAWDLIETLNGSADTGLRQGTIETTTARARSYETGKNVGEAITQLTEVIGGFDFDVLPLDPTAEGGKLAEFVVYASQGEARSDLLWGYGAGTMSNVVEVSRKMTPPINRVHMTTSDGLESIAEDAASIAKYGEWAVSRSAPNDVSNQSTLDQRAQEALRPEWVRLVSFTPDADLGPQPFDDYWLGDTGGFRAVEGAFSESFAPRVNAITITEDADGSEAHELESLVA